jgi:hypothetical protein
MFVTWPGFDLQNTGVFQSASCLPLTAISSSQLTRAHFGTMRLGIVFLAVPALLSSVLARGPRPEPRGARKDSLECDVAIMGGGAAGSYAAVRLRDAGKKVIVIEQKTHLGGHVDTFTVPGTSVAVDFGVLAYLEPPGVRDFFGRFGIQLESAPIPSYQVEYVDFTTGLPITSGNSITAEAHPKAVEPRHSRDLWLTFSLGPKRPRRNPVPDALPVPRVERTVVLDFHAPDLIVPVYRYRLALLGNVFGMGGLVLVLRLGLVLVLMLVPWFIVRLRK